MNTNNLITKSEIKNEHGICPDCKSPFVREGLCSKCGLYVAGDGEYRVCHECGEAMVDGFCIDMGSEYYCSESCLKKHYTWKQWLEIYEDKSQSYWTQWDGYFETIHPPIDALVVINTDGLIDEVVCANKVNYIVVDYSHLKNTSKSEVKDWLDSIDDSIQKKETFKSTFDDVRIVCLREPE